MEMGSREYVKHNNNKNTVGLYVLLLFIKKEGLAGEIIQIVFLKGLPKTTPQSGHTPLADSTLWYVSI